MKKASFYSLKKHNRIRDRFLHLLTHSKLRFYAFPVWMIQMSIVFILNIPTNWKRVAEYNRFYRNQGIKISYADILFSCFKYGSTIEEYFVFRFFQRNAKDRATWITESIRHCVGRQFNDQHYSLMRDKDEFSKTFKQFMGREVVSFGPNSDFTEIQKWCERQKRIVIKPRFGAEGVGVEILDYAQDEAKGVAYLKQLSEKGEFVLEEVLSQHSEMAKFNPKSVNSLRIIAIDSAGQFGVLGAFFRMGNGGVIDNFSAGGLVAPVDLDTGKVIAGAITMDPTDDRVEDIHPLTHEKIIGHQIPFWKETLELVKKMSDQVKGDKSIGWDIAITPEGPVLIEANSVWGTFMLQLTLERGMLERLIPYIDHNYLFPTHRKRFGLKRGKA